MILLNNYIVKKQYIDPTLNKSPKIFNLFLNDLTILVENVQNIPKYGIIIEYINDGLNIF